MTQSILYALDFDGVICDSAVETGITGWKAASQIWSDMQGPAPSVLIEQFRLLRPIIETGYEAILAMRLLHLGNSVDSIYSSYADKTQALLAQAQVTTDDLKKLFGQTRDTWIADDLADWVAMNPLFAGVAEKLQQLGQRHSWLIITTKQERFVKQILQANAIELADQAIYGLDRNLSKVEVLKNLLNQQSEQAIYFVEDRLPTLLNVAKQPELASVKLIFALWGYNTEADKALAAEQGLLSQGLNQFLID
jgi:phosphoglycolate phosphatase-like HAD superfamily hydrolase